MSNNFWRGFEKQAVSVGQVKKIKLRKPGGDPIPPKHPEVLNPKETRFRVPGENRAPKQSSRFRTPGG